MFLKCLSKLVPLSIGPLMQPSSEWMMSHSSYQGTLGSLMSSIDQGVFCYYRVGIGFPEFFPPYTQGFGCFIIYIQQVMTLHVSKVIGSIIL